LRYHQLDLLTFRLLQTLLAFFLFFCEKKKRYENKA